MPKQKASAVPPKLTEAEQDLVWHMQNGYQLETDSLGAEPVLRQLKDDEVVRPAAANRNTRFPQFTRKPPDPQWFPVLLEP